MERIKTVLNTAFGKSAAIFLNRKLGFYLLRSVLNCEFSACFHAPLPSAKTLAVIVERHTRTRTN